MSRQLEGADSHGDAAGRNSSSRVLRSSQCMYPSTKHPGKSPLSMEGGMNCKICESPGFRARRIKSPSFHENKIFGFSQSHKMPIRKRNLPDIQTRQIGSYSPFLEYQQGQLRNLSESISERTEPKDIEFEYAHRRTFLYMCDGPLCVSEAFPIVYRQQAVHPLVSRSVLAGPHLLDMISIGNSA